jgi:hypothetical protein
MWWLLVELLIYVSGAGSLASELDNRDEFTIERDRRALALFAFLLLGFVIGAVTGVVISQRVLPFRPFKGVSLILLPLALGGAMEGLRRVRSASRSHLATWYGGATLGIGLAAGRLLVLWNATP